MSAWAESPDGADGPLASAGARRTNSETGIMIEATISATICIEVRSHDARPARRHGAMVIGAMPMPAETSDNRKTPVGVEPAGATGHHRRKDRSRSSPHHPAR